MTDSKQWQAEQAQFNDTSRYQDIMNHPRHISRAHLPMTKRDRAGQFSPFAALTGYHELLAKTAARYANKKYPTGQQLRAIFNFFHHCKKGEKLTLTYFNGQSGYYDHYQGQLDQVNWAQQEAYFDDESHIPLRNIRQVRRENSNGHQNAATSHHHQG
ncbi:hypothetical protein [Limosilactobacillus sp.]|jgi:hypothetical protein|uniref:hypothetical protein n=1 Tax=Limosilactobacillus sp. TaxID=2773925 RepID=UPI0035A1C070